MENSTPSISPSIPCDIVQADQVSENVSKSPCILHQSATNIFPRNSSDFIQHNVSNKAPFDSLCNVVSSNNDGEHISPNDCMTVNKKIINKDDLRDIEVQTDKSRLYSYKPNPSPNKQRKKSPKSELTGSNPGQICQYGRGIKIFRSDDNRGVYFPYIYPTDRREIVHRFPPYIPKKLISINLFDEEPEINISKSFGTEKVSFIKRGDDGYGTKPSIHSKTSLEESSLIKNSDTVNGSVLSKKSTSSHKSTKSSKSRDRVRSKSIEKKNYSIEYIGTPIKNELSNTSRRTICNDLSVSKNMSFNKSKRYNSTGSRLEPKTTVIEISPKEKKKPLPFYLQMALKQQENRAKRNKDTHYMRNSGPIDELSSIIQAEHSRSTKKSTVDSSDETRVFSLKGKKSEKKVSPSPSKSGAKKSGLTNNSAKKSTNSSIIRENLNNSLQSGDLRRSLSKLNESTIITRSNNDTTVNSGEISKHTKNSKNSISESPTGKSHPNSRCVTPPKSSSKHTSRSLLDPPSKSSNKLKSSTSKSPRRDVQTKSKDSLNNQNSTSYDDNNRSQTVSKTVSISNILLNESNNVSRARLMRNKSKMNNMTNSLDESISISMKDSVNNSGYKSRRVSHIVPLSDDSKHDLRKPGANVKYSKQFVASESTPVNQFHKPHHFSNTFLNNVADMKAVYVSGEDDLSPRNYANIIYPANIASMKCDSYSELGIWIRRTEE